MLFFSLARGPARPSSCSSSSWPTRCGRRLPDFRHTVEAVSQYPVLPLLFQQLIIKLFAILFGFLDFLVDLVEFCLAPLSLAVEQLLLFVDEANDEEVLILELLEDVVEGPGRHAFHDALGSITHLQLSIMWLCTLLSSLSTLGSSRHFSLRNEDLDVLLLPSSRLLLLLVRILFLRMLGGIRQHTPDINHELLVLILNLEELFKLLLFPIKLVDLHVQSFQLGHEHPALLPHASALLTQLRQLLRSILSLLFILFLMLIHLVHLSTQFLSLSII